MDTSKLDFKFEINGYKIFSDPSLLVDEKDFVDLSLWDRLTSWPWKPWKKRYELMIKVADPKVYKDGNNIIGHPYTITLMSRAMVEKISGLD